PAEDLLAGAVGVGVGGVEEVDPQLQGPEQEGPAPLLVQRPGVGAALGHAVAHAPQAEARDLEAGLSEVHVVHRSPPHPATPPNSRAARVPAALAFFPNTRENSPARVPTSGGAVQGETWPRVAVLGAGAVGCYFGGMLARAGAPVTLIGRPHHVEAL